MDVLSDILVSIKVESMAIATFVLGMPWALDVDPFKVPSCYSVIEGGCWFMPKGAVPRYLARGDSVIAPHGGSYILAGAPGLLPIGIDEVWTANGLPHYRRQEYSRHEVRSPITLRWGEGGARTRVLALAFAFSGDAHMTLLRSLPEFFYVDAADSEGFPWLRAAMDFFRAEEGVMRPGYAALARELASLIFTSLVRAHVVNAGDLPRGWLRGLSDPKISAALSAIHGAPATDWSLVTLAVQAGMSRSAFAARFTELTGQSPIAYLTSWRMHLAAERLAKGSVKVAQLAEDYGYKSEGAFRNAFKHHMGQSARVSRKSTKS